jgi:hypothetical protein
MNKFGKTKLVLAGTLVGLSLTGCVMSATPLAGSIYTDTKWDGQVNPGTPGDKVGTACQDGLLGFTLSGDASITAAMKNGGITKISYVDHSSNNVLYLYAKYCTIVHGY